MASTEFPAAVVYALSCVGLEDLRLKPKQDKALIHLYYNGDDVNRLVPWQVFMLPTAALMFHYKLQSEVF